MQARPRPGAARRRPDGRTDSVNPSCMQYSPNALLQHQRPRHPGGELLLINRDRDAGQAGDRTAKKRFDALHRVSVIVSMTQMLAVLVVLVRYMVR